MYTIRTLRVPSAAVAVALALSTGSCDSGGGAGGGGPGTNDASTGSSGGGLARDGGIDGSPGGASACTTDADCMARLSTTTPADCATATCNALLGVCVFSARDEDGDGHPAARCKSTDPSVTIVVGDDCNDSDPNLYAGHPEPCSTTEDGGVPAGKLCKPGQITCLPDGTESQCSNTVACQNQACVNGTCTGGCTPGTSQCGGPTKNGVQTCVADGSWGSPVDCGSASCQAAGGTAQCEGSCAPGSAICGGVNGVQTCDSTGTWGSPVACVGTTCVDDPCPRLGVCDSCQGSCAPGESICTNNGVRSCVSGGAWGRPVACRDQTCIDSTSSPGDGGTDSGSDADAEASTDAGGTDAASAGERSASCQGVCAPGQKNCSGVQPQTCGASGQWQDTGAACSGSTPACSAGTCVNCVPDSLGCNGVQPQQCTLTGSAMVDIGSACSGNTPACLVGSCVQCTTDSDCTSLPNCCSNICVDKRIDSNNCGSCGTQCPSGSTCAYGDCEVTLYTGNPYGIAIDSANVYWTDNGVGTINYAPKGGGTVTTLATGQTEPYFIAVDATNAYWTNNTNPGQVMSVPLGGGTPTTLADGQNSPYGIAIDALNVYWTNYGDGTVMMVAKGGGTPITLASGGSGPQAIAVDAANVYWTDYTLGTINELPLSSAGITTDDAGLTADGGSVTTLASGQFAPCSIAIDANNVYWIGSSSQPVMAVPIAGGAASTIATGDETYAITVDATNVYWIDDTGVLTTPLSGGTPVTLGDWNYGPSIAVDATSVYWSTGYAVMQATPK